MRLAGRRILLTGASGYLGSNLAARLVAEGAAVCALLRPTSDREALRRKGVLDALRIVPIDEAGAFETAAADFGPDSIVHCAACCEGGDDPATAARLLEANISFPTRLLAAASRLGVERFVNTGTSWQNSDSELFRPFNLYAATKQAFEALAEHYALAGLDVTTLRLFDVYGPDDPRGKIVNLLKRTVGAASPLDMSPGGQFIDLVHVDDACEAFVAVLLTPTARGSRVYGVSSGAPLQLRDLVDLFERVRGVRCEIRFGGRPYREREVMMPNRSYPSVPGWAPKIDTAVGLAAI